MPKKITLLEVLARPLSRDRVVFRGLKTRAEFAAGDGDGEKTIDPEGGSRGAGIIRGASLIAAGEALGHDSWIDETALDQIVELAADSDNGIKVRFTHPSMSGDGLGSYLGRAKNINRDGDQVFGDVHFSPTARDSNPEGDRGGYVMELAEDDPSAFGMSIVFDHDFDAEDQFRIENQVFDDDDDDKQYGRFESPDEANSDNFPHIRLAKLYGADFVDSPAANPSGVFHSGPTAAILTQAESVLDYAFSLSDDVPENSGGLSAERLRGFLTKFLDSRGITFTKEPDMTTKTTKKQLDDDPAVTEVEEVNDEAVDDIEDQIDEDSPTADVELELEKVSLSELGRFVDKFGANAGSEYIRDGVSFTRAMELEFDKLKQNQSLGIGDDRGEKDPVKKNTESTAKRFGLAKGIEALAGELSWSGSRSRAEIN
jgi:hypothetical protein